MTDKIKNFETFNDGIIKIYTVTNISKPGDRPKDGLSIKYSLRFDYRTIGIKRNFEAMQAQVEINEMIAVQMHRDISTQDVVMINNDDTQYKITQVQHKKDTLPPTSLLTLTRLEAKYDFKTI